MQTHPLAQDDNLLESRRTLRRHKTMATGLLAVMAGVYAGAEALPATGDAAFWVGLLRAGAEAALVGGLADWFAVTALFRHPLGLPIPHTALVRRNKDRIGEGIGRFVTTNFLAPELVGARIRALDPAARVGAWLSRPENAAKAADHIADLLPPLLRTLEDERVRELFGRAVTAQIRAFDLGPMAGRLMLLLRGEDTDVIVSQVAEFARSHLRENEHRILEMVEQRSRWWVPSKVDRRIAEAIANGVYELLAQVSQPDHPTRLALNRSMIDLAYRLQTDDDLQARLEEMKEELVHHPEVQRQIGRLWEVLRQAVLEAAERPESRLRRALADSLRALGRRLGDDEDLRGFVNDRAEGVVRAVIVPWREEIGAFIADVVRQWDPDTVSDRMELAVGKDLQFIRVNGTLVGAIVGCLLYLLTTGIHAAVP